MRRSTLLELSGMEFHEVAHVCRCSTGELVHGVCHAVVTPLLVQLGHGREMPDGVLGKPHLAKAFAPHRERNVAILAASMLVSERRSEDLGASFSAAVAGAAGFARGRAAALRVASSGSLGADALRGKGRAGFGLKKRRPGTGEARAFSGLSCRRREGIGSGTDTVRACAAQAE